MTPTDKLIADNLWRDISEAPGDGRRFLCLWLTHDPRAKDGLTLSVTRWVDDEYGVGWMPDIACVLPINQDAAKLFRPIPDDRLANALRVAVEALNSITNAEYDYETGYHSNETAEYALAKIERIAEEKCDG